MAPILAFKQLCCNWLKLRFSDFSVLTTEIAEKWTKVAL